MCCPWLLAGCVDYRRGAEDRDALRQHLWYLVDELKDDWFTIPFLGLLSNLIDFESEEVQHAISLRAWKAIGTCCPMEFQHGRNQGRAHESMHWQQFVAQSLNHEGMLRSTWQQKAMSTQTSLGSRPVPQPKKKRSASVWDIAREEEKAARSTLGHKVHITSTEFIDAARERVNDIHNNLAMIEGRLAELEQRRMGTAHQPALDHPVPHGPPISMAPDAGSAALALLAGAARHGSAAVVRH